MVVFIFLSTYFFDFSRKYFTPQKTRYFSGFQGNFFARSKQKNKNYLKNSFYFFSKGFKKPKQKTAPPQKRSLIVIFFEIGSRHNTCRLTPDTLFQRRKTSSCTPKAKIMLTLTSKKHRAQKTKKAGEESPADNA